ncbi:homoserine kinase [Acrasis kona]|uniref:Homoserine kinase n=1 Tax=Acrasis kona TaxID=1008807 RepID=A0AAW2ZGU3_9EUKA
MQIPTTLVKIENRDGHLCAWPDGSVSLEKDITNKHFYWFMERFDTGFHVFRSQFGRYLQIIGDEVNANFTPDSQSFTNMFYIIYTTIQGNQVHIRSIYNTYLSIRNFIPTSSNCVVGGQDEVFYLVRVEDSENKDRECTVSEEELNFDQSFLS